MRIRDTMYGSLSIFWDAVIVNQAALKLMGNSVRLPKCSNFLNRGVKLLSHALEDNQPYI